MSAKSILKTVLFDNTTLVGLVGTDSQGNPKIFPTYNDSKEDVPMVCFERINEVGQSHGDNDTEVLGTAFRIYAIGHNSVTQIEQAVKDALKTGLEDQQYTPVRVTADNYETEDKLYITVMQTTIYED